MLINMPNRDTQLCISLAGRPGNFGTRFHNYLYQKLAINYLYKAFTTTDLAAAINGIRALAIRGCAVSMPFKEVCIPYLDELDYSASSIQSVNTIVNSNGYLKAYNTDYLAVINLLTQNCIDATTPFVLRGSGGMAKAVAGALFHSGFHNGTILARNKEKGTTLASCYHYNWIDYEAKISPVMAKMIINVTPIGMEGDSEADTLAFSKHIIEQAEIIFDVVALPFSTPMIKYAQSLAKKTIISGAKVALLQAVKQFELYTGIIPDEQLIIEAEKFARTT